MPFDGLTCTLAPKTALARLLTELGIEPVPDTVLEQHKLSEIAKHPASRMFNHPGLYQLGGLLTSALCMAITMLTVIMWIGYDRGSTPLSSTLCVSVAGLISFIAMFKFGLAATLKGPAHWVEERSFSLRDVPAPIRLVARKIEQEDKHVEFIIGTLYQKTVALDPYLIVEVYDRATGETDRACLGIWDGDTIIHRAQLT